MKRSTSKKAREIINLIEKNYHDLNYRYSDEDNFVLLKSRVLKLKDIFEGLEDGNYLVVGHGMVLKMFTGILIFGSNVTSHQFKDLSSLLSLENTGICGFTYENKKWSLGTWNILKI